MRSGAASIFEIEQRIHRSVILALICLCISLIIVSPAFSQDDDTDAAPPPIKAVPTTEKDELASAPTLKDRTRSYLTFMDGHIAAAEKLSGNDANGAFKELGMFEALVDDSVTSLAKGDTNSVKTLDALRKLEIGLRAFMPRLETIRRILPLNCDEYVRRLMGHLRDARAKAVDPMFSDNVVKPKTAQNQ